MNISPKAESKQHEGVDDKDRDGSNVQENRDSWGLKKREEQDWEKRKRDEMNRMVL